MTVTINISSVLDAYRRLNDEDPSRLVSLWREIAAVEAQNRFETALRDAREIDDDDEYYAAVERAADECERDIAAA